jgi:Breast carcinoma amplified sequence 2 (BCAS2)
MRHGTTAAIKQLLFLLFRIPLPCLYSTVLTMPSASINSKKRPAPSPADDDTPVTPVVVSRDALMDSLPYIDGTHEDYEEYAAALIEEEMKTFPPAPLPKQQHPIKFRTPLMEHEYHQRLIDDGQNHPPLTFWNGPAAPPSSEDASEKAWQAAVQAAKVQYEGERARSMTLDVKKDSGAALLWKGFNGTMDLQLQAAQKALHQQRQLVEQINLQRSIDQQKAGKELQLLTARYQIALERRFRLEQATTALELLS